MVEPPLTPVTTPLASTVATDGLLDVNVKALSLASLGMTVTVSVTYFYLDTDAEAGVISIPVT